MCGLALLGVAPTAPAPALPKASAKPVGYRADSCSYAPGAGGRVLTCKGHVRIWRDDLSLSCDSMVARFDAAGVLTDAACHGAVEIITAQATAQAGQARFDARTQAVELTGKPKALQQGSVLRGTVIRLNIQSGEMAVEGAVEGVLSPQAVPVGRIPGGGSP